jgi:dipeptidyl aminopeptidase/acylaminoacyl peptidase
MKFERTENLALAFTAVFSMVLGGTAVVSIVVLAGLLSEFAVVPLHAQTRPAVELEAAMTKEQVDGDLKTAIAAYQKIAADKSAPRDVRAKALLHLAGCYEKLGQQAQSVYQQIVRDFADQPAAVQARARLAALKQDDRPAAPATMTQRKIEITTPNLGPGDTDGRRAVYWNDATSELVYGDLTGHSKRVILKAKLSDLVSWWPSRDFSMVILQFASKPDQPATYAVVNTDGTGYREIARLAGRPECENWARDNRYILLCSQPQEGTNRLLRISVADGQVSELVSLKTGTIRAATFSHDGRLVAYQVTASVADPVSRIFILPAKGGEAQLVYEERPTAGSFRWQQWLRLLDWTADGRYLAIASERTGKGALHLLPIRDGKSAGAPVFLRYGDFEEGVTTTAGGLIYSSVKPGGLWYLSIASLDANGRPGGWKRLDLRLGNMANPMQGWSGDSNQIMYVAGNRDLGQSGGEVVHLRDLSTGEDREIYHARGATECTWAVQQPKVFCSDRGETMDVLSIALDSGEIARLGTLKAPAIILYPSRDDRALYMFRTDPAGEMLRWEIATGRETTLDRFPSAAVELVSQDERWLVRWTNQNIAIRPTAGGDWKPLVSLSKDVFTGHVNFTADGNWLLYHDLDSTGKHSLFRVATAGGQPELLGDFPTNSLSGSLEISPDGSKVIVSAAESETGYELWSLENFVPPAPKP